MAPNNLSPHESVADVDIDEKHADKEMTQHIEGDHATFENRHFSTMTAEDRATALKLANEADPGPPIASYRFLCFIATCFVVIVNSCDTGFDTTIMSSVNSMITFQSYFGLEGASVGTGILFVSLNFVRKFCLTIQGIYTVGGVTAFLPNIILPDLIGRRYSMAYGNTLLM
jgi:hypothetical protein